MSLASVTLLLAVAQAPLPEEQVGGAVLSRFTVEGESSQARMGRAVAAGGDFDGDGIGDVVVTADYEDPNGLPDAGSVWVLSGADGSLILRVNGTVAGIQLGSSVASGADFDGDTIPDLVVGARGVDTPGGIDRGAVFVFSGADGSLIRRVDGTQDFAALGGAVAILGDVDGDTVPDFAAGAEWFDGVAPNAGRLQVHSGATGALLYAVGGVHGYNLLGSAVVALGDISGDGVPDFAVGDRGRTIGGALRAGGCTIRSGVDGAIIRDINGQESFDYCGAALAQVGDLDGDGVGDLAVSSHNSSPGGRVAGGKVRLFSTRTGAFIFPINSLLPQSWLGFSVCDAGDVDGDGIGDIGVGATLEDPLTTTDAGSFYVFSGFDRSLLFRINGPERMANMGYSCVGLGDLDGDGSLEVAVAAAGATGAASSASPMPGAGSVTVYGLDPQLRLTANVFSQSAGATIDMDVDFPAAEAGRSYVLLFSALPAGFNQFGSFTIPLQFDQFTGNAFNGSYPPVFQQPIGTLDANGDATIVFSVGPGQIAAGAVGNTFRACVVSADIQQSVPFAVTSTQRMTLEP